MANLSLYLALILNQGTIDKIPSYTTVSPGYSSKSGTAEKAQSYTRAFSVKHNR